MKLKGRNAYEIVRMWTVIVKKMQTRLHFVFKRFLVYLSEETFIESIHLHI